MGGIVNIKSLKRMAVKLPIEIRELILMLPDVIERDDLISKMDLILPKL